MQTLIEFKYVNKLYAHKSVIRNLSFQLKQGEVIVLLGPSGCGKTTVLNIATGLLKPTSGEVKTHTEQRGYVFQEPRLLPWKTVVDNVLFGMADPNGKKEEAMQLLEKVDLAHVVDAYPRQLSGGMKQRVSIARALAASPELILMDEPFAALDKVIKTELLEAIIHIIEKVHVGILYVTHDYEEAIKIADRILLFNGVHGGNYQEISLEQSRLTRDEAYIRKQINEINQRIRECRENVCV